MGSKTKQKVNSNPNGIEKKFQDLDIKNNERTITLTFCEVAENHVGMQKIGQLAEKGFSIEELQNAKENFEKQGCKCEMIELGNGGGEEEAAVLIIRNGLDVLLQTKDEGQFLEELDKLDWDVKFLNKGRICNKIARYNLCFANFSQEPNYEKGQGRIIEISTVNSLKEVIENLANFVGPSAQNLIAEGNYYYDAKKCFIGLHSDLERKKVIALRIGGNQSFPIYYMWFLNNQKISDKIKIDLYHKDIYIMSQKAVGNDGRKRKIPILRHCAGYEENIKEKKTNKKK